MSRLTIPVTGDCPLCGKATYGTTGLTAADSPNGPTSITQILIKHNGQYICKSCKKILILREQSKEIGRQYRKEEQFLSRAGLLTTFEE